jgi:hypothetical protein
VCNPQDLGALIRTRGDVEKSGDEAKPEDSRPWWGEHPIMAGIERKYRSPDQDMRDGKGGGHKQGDLRRDG